MEVKILIIYLCPETQKDDFALKPFTDSPTHSYVYTTSLDKHTTS